MAVVMQSSVGFFFQMNRLVKVFDAFDEKSDVYGMSARACFENGHFSIFHHYR
jgi:hypothetical protein